MSEHPEFCKTTGFCSVKKKKNTRLLVYILRTTFLPQKQGIIAKQVQFQTNSENGCGLQLFRCKTSLVLLKTGQKQNKKVVMVSSIIYSLLFQIYAAQCFTFLFSLSFPVVNP